MDVFRGIEYADLAFTHDRSGFHPGGVDVGDVEGVKKISRSRVAGVRDQIDLGKARGLDVPGVGFDRDVMFEQGAGFGVPVEVFFELTLFGPQASVDGGRTDLEQLLLGLGREREALDCPWQPQRQEGFEARRARIACGLPDRRQSPDHFGSVGGASALGSSGSGFLWSWTVEQPNGVFAVVAANLTELVENARSQSLGCFSVTEINRFEVIPFGLSTHENVTLPGCWLSPTSVGYIPNESTIFPSVTF